MAASICVREVFWAKHSIYEGLWIGFCRAPGRQTQWYDGRGTSQTSDGNRHDFQENSEGYKCVQKTSKGIDTEHCTHTQVQLVEPQLVTVV